MNNSSTSASLTEILRDADSEDLDVLVDYITDSGQGRISLDKEICAKLVKARFERNYGLNERMFIEREIRNFGGNTVANLARDVRGFLGGISLMMTPGLSIDSVGAVPHDEIVRDVARHLKVKVDKDASTPVVEDGILKVLLLASFEKMKPEEREAILKDLDIPDAADLARRSIAAISIGVLATSLSTAMAYQLSRFVASGTVSALLGRALTMGAASMVARPVAVLAGPIGWAVTGAWALADMASPAYRVTVPCVVQVAYMRKKAQMKIDQSGALAHQALTNSIS